MTLGRYNIKM